MVLLSLFMAVVLDLCWISKAIPWTSSLLGINLIPVILGIPVNFGLVLGLVPVLSLFILFYAGSLLAGNRFRDEAGRRHLRRKCGALAAAALAIPTCMVLSGLIYYGVQDQLPKNLRNSIESLGLDADVYAFFTQDEVIHIRGGLVLLAGFMLGVFIFVRKAHSVSARSNAGTNLAKGSLETAA